jgi:LmbE family N-acetylglucosaminyl deacetylase
MNHLDLLGFSRYLLIIAHPDDEVNCAVLLHRLLERGKHIKIVLLTSGDAGVNAAGRPMEMAESIETMGLTPHHLESLGISEKDLLGNAGGVYRQVLQVATNYKPDCILSLDYEGGHEGHDIAAFMANKAAQKLKSAHVVFPDYHFRDMHRHGLEFLPGRQPDYALELTEADKDLKIKLLEAHRGQIGFYLRLQKVQDNYFALLFEREVYRLFPDSYDFLTRPSYQIGYEYHRNGFKFADVVKAAQSVEIAGSDKL